LVAATNPVTHYVITDDDSLGVNTVTFYTATGSTGALTQTGEIHTGLGIGGGFFGAPRVSVIHSKTDGCVYVSNAGSADVTSIVVQSQQLVGRFHASLGDAGAANGIGLATNGKYLYASFTDSNTIGTYKLRPGCALQFVSDINAIGFQGGSVDGMAAHKNILVVTYGDGSIQSFNIKSGAPISNGDEQNSTGSPGENFPGGVDITKDGHYAIFGDVSTSTTIEVSDISSGKLTTTLAYNLGPELSSSTIRLSPDETLLYIANTQSGKVSVAFFDKTTGIVSPGCTSARLNGFGSQWAYLGSVVNEKISGTGGVLYVAEFGSPSSIGIVEIQSSGGACTLMESSSSPAPDPNSPGLLSIGVYPPRLF
jgi:6-phosphogluconolactonase (cycloisomerase 2 family)